MSFVARNHPQQQTRDTVDDRGTPWEVFNPLHAIHRFTVDAAAAPHNAKLPRFWTSEDDGLSQKWANERVWCNPPYSNIRPWVEKAADSPSLSVLLLPANRTEQAWWQDLIEPNRDGRGSNRISVQFVRRRMRFLIADDDEVKPNARPPFGVCLVVFRQTK